MPRVPSRNRAGTMGFLMEDRCPFPERPLGINSDDLKDRIGEGFRKGLSGIRLDAVGVGRTQDASGPISNRTAGRIYSASNAAG